MTKSMTACGRSSVEENGAHFVVELQSVNRKHLDIQVHLPRTLSFFEADIRSVVAKAATRGQISIRLSALFHTNAPYKVVPNLALAEEVKKAWDELGERLGCDGFKSDYLAAAPDILNVEFSKVDQPRVWDVLLKALNEAIEELNKMKCQEGNALKKDFDERLALIGDNLDQIFTLSTGLPEKWKAKIEARLKELGQAFDVDERIIRELALMADKFDITEEIVRFRSHIEQFKSYMSQEGTFGKTLEFILQELGREINTIGSKCQDVEISKLVIVVKSELERMREQVQNVE